MLTIKPTSGPHTGADSGVGRVMRQVIYALLPATAFGLYLFGWPAVNLLLITLFAALGFEYICLKWVGKPALPALADGSALLTGWLLAMTLPPWAPWWIGVIGAGLAIVLGKHVYGGLGQNPFNPAMLARAVLLISFPLEMTTWANVTPWFSDAAPGFDEGLAITLSGLGNPDAHTGATLLGHVKTEAMQHRPVSESLADFGGQSPWLGITRGSLGETSALLLLAGGVWLLRKRIITWHIPVSMLASVAVMATVFHALDPDHYLGAGVHLGSGALMCAAFFIATDYVTSPNTPLGQIIFGASCGLLIYLIRTWGGYPEGVGFAVLLMNACTPLIDHYIKPRIHGRDRRGRPLNRSGDALLPGFRLLIAVSAADAVCRDWAGKFSEKVVKPWAASRQDSAGYDLLCAVLGREPATGTSIPRNADTLIGGFMKSIGRPNSWANFKKRHGVVREGFRNVLDGMRSLPLRLRSLTARDAVVFLKISCGIARRGFGRAKILLIGTVSVLRTCRRKISESGLRAMKERSNTHDPR